MSAPCSPRGGAQVVIGLSNPWRVQLLSTSVRVRSPRLLGLVRAVGAPRGGAAMRAALLAAFGVSCSLVVVPGLGWMKAAGPHSGDSC